MKKKMTVRAKVGYRFFLSVVTAAALTSCASERPKIQFPEPLLKSGGAAREEAPSVPGVSPTDSDVAQRFFSTPVKPEQLKDVQYLDLAGAGGPRFKSSQPISLNVEGMALPAFINEVFGNLLGVSFEISPDLQTLTNLVTIRITQPESPEAVYRMTREVLGRYGVDTHWDGAMLRFVPSRGKAVGDAPLIVTGTTLPNVPVSHRDVFLVYVLQSVAIDDALRWLNDIFEGQGLKFERDSSRSSIWIKGRPNMVEQVSRVLAMLDKPAMRGRNSMRIEPLYFEADKLAKSLVDVLGAEGTSAAIGQAASVMLLPMREINSILVFANDPAAIEHVKAWVEELDRPGKRAEGEALFRYAVRNTLAKSVLEVLQPLLGGEGKGKDSGTGLGEDAKSAPASSQSASKPTVSANTSFAKGELVLDEARNALLFKGAPDTWFQLLPVIREMDVAPRQALIEVLVAEVQLSDAFSFGIEWAINSAALGESLFVIDKPTSGGGTPTAKDIGNGVRIGATGLSYYPISNSGQTRAVLNLLAEDKNVVIHQTPRIMVKSGEEASINVGTQVPVLTSQSNVPGQTQNGTSALVQQIQYLSTGVNLSVKPVIYEGGRVDLTINQQLSESTTTNTLTPTILNRTVTTSLSVNDGGSVLIGGLITNNTSGGETKVPVLGDIPLIGELFKSRSRKNNRTELMVLIVPYVIEDSAAAERLTRSFREKLELMVEGRPDTVDNTKAVGQ